MFEVTVERMFAAARAASRVLHVEHIELLDAPSVLFAARIRPSSVRSVQVSFEGPGDAYVDPRMLAVRNVARLHRALAVGGPAVGVEAAESRPGRLSGQLALASGATLSFDFQSNPALSRRTKLRIDTVAGLWEQRGDQVFRDGTEVTLVSVGGLFERDHRASMARILDAAPPYVDEARILHVLDIVDRLSTLSVGPLSPR